MKAHGNSARGPWSSRPRAFGAAALKTSAVVGTALTLINHPQILWGHVTSEIVLPTIGNYVVPFLVAGYTRHVLLRRMGDGTKDS